MKTNVVDSDVDVDSRNADRDVRTDDCGYQRQQEKVAVDDSWRERHCGVEHTDAPTAMMNHM